ncbi:TraR/DksA C4-type zinc finger protein [Caldalkalibacillus salinus]|uniref:TraR/DksA C4-type zinc finger protein n=1 Tax=Caldalkalibacillus salinus TaxID=2803787 RepID=UPI001922FA1A|nr:TraR/DksA C4-type zinc finger protein [Caldalkalibacillus salinus]
MDPMYLGMREQLIKEKTELDIRLHENGDFQLKHAMSDSDGELSQYDNHPADTASTMYEREKDLALREHDHHQREEIEAALQRMEEGSYGICVTCGRTISLERLQAVPTTKHCVEHERTPRYSSVRPVEEDVLTGFEQFNFDDDDDQTQFDAEDAYQAVARFDETYYNDYLDDDESRGAVEPIEGFIITDMDGNVVDESVDVNRNRSYENYIQDGEGYGTIWEDEIIMPDTDVD